MYDNTYKDVVSTIAYLKQRDDIDKDHIGIFGFSMGTFFAFKYGAEHPKQVKTIIAAVPPLLKDDRSKRSIPPFAHKLQIPVLMLVANQDQWTPLENSKWLYDTIPATDKHIIIYDSTHSLPVDYTTQAIDWLKKYLQ